MDRLSVVTLATAMKYTDSEIAGGGAIKGKNCQIKSKTAIDGGTRITFAWYLDDGTEQNTTMDVMDGEQGEEGNGVKAAAIVNSHLILTLDDDTTIDAGLVSGFDTDMSHITDIDLSNLVDGQILKYNGVTRKWENASASTVDTSLVDLNDVDVENLSDGQIIVWDATAGRWKNADNSPAITIDSVPTQGSTNAVSSGGVFSALPTATSDLNNDSGFITNLVNDLTNYYLKTETYTKTEVDTLIGAISTMHIEVVAGLPSSNIQTNVIYLVPKATAQTDNVYDEYINTDGTSAGWELIGDTEVDLSNYVTTTDLSTALADYVTTVGLSTILAGYVQKSQTAGLLKNDGTVDTNTYATTSSLSDYIAKSQTAGLVKNDGTIDTNTYATTAALNDKVDKVSGKGLSTNDYTTAEKTKLTGIATGANKKHKKLYTLTANTWRASQSDYGVYTYRISISDPYFDINEPLNVYFADGHDSYDDPYFNNAKYKVYKNIYNGSYGGSVEDYPSQLVLYYYDAKNLTAPSTTINIYVEGIVKEWGA